MHKKLHNPKAYSPAVYIPCWLIQVSNQFLSHQAKLLYGRLAQWATEGGRVYRSIPQLSEELGCSKSTIDRGIKELKDCGLIGTFHPQKGGVSHFEFYDHDWMYAPIKEQLAYKSNNYIPTSDVTLPHVKSDVTPTSDVTSINIKEIKRNIINKKLNNISTSGEVRNCRYNEFDEHQVENTKSGYKPNQVKNEKNDAQVIETEIESLRSDYWYNQTKNQSLSKQKSRFDLKNILNENIFQVPEQIILDWIENRKKKKAPVTQTAWNKINKELAKCKERGIDPIDAFETMVASGWQSLKSEYFDKPTASPNKSRVNNMDTSWASDVFKPFHEMDIGV